VKQIFVALVLEERCDHLDLLLTHKVSPADFNGVKVFKKRE